jgi:hypothetical protein
MTTETSTSTQFVNRKASRLLALIMATLSMIGLLSFVGSSPASASASGCSAWGAKTVANIPIAKGVYCVGLNGSGTYVNTVAASFNAAGSVCNWNITAEFFDSNGKWYQTIPAPTHWGCSWSGSDVVSVFGNKQRGSMCSTLKQNGARIQSVCHSIY